MYDCNIYIYIYIYIYCILRVSYIQHKGNVSLEKVTEKGAKISVECLMTVQKRKRTVANHKILASYVTVLQLCEHPVLLSVPQLNGLPNC